MITLGFKDGKIIAEIVKEEDNGFKACVSMLKSQKFAWNPNERQWEKSAVLYSKDLYDILMMVTKVYFPQTVKDSIENYPKTLPTEIEIKPQIDHIDYSEFSDFKPIVGKHPYENFQDEDIRRALSMNRFLFAWTMGCGKSFATSIIYEYQRKNAGTEKMFLFTTRIGTLNLKNELCKFCKHLNKDDILVFNSPASFKKYSRQIFDNEEVCDKKVLVFSYDSWKLVANSYGDKKQGKKQNVPIMNFFKDTVPLLCLDECHQLSNPKSERSKAVFKYLPYFKYRYLFSATPADKNEKIYSAAMVLDPKLVLFLKYSEWLAKYNDIGTWFSKYAINKKGWHEDEIAELNKELAKYSAKREAKHVLDLPECIMVDPYLIEMSDKQKDLYRKVVNDIVNNIIKKNPDMSASSVDVVKEAFSTVMAFVENPNVVGKGSTEYLSPKMKEVCAAYNFSKDFAKLDVVDAILEDEFENEKRGIIWYTHPLTKDCLMERYKDFDPILVSAEMKEDERNAQIKEFQKDPKHKILIASEYILSTSVTLIECKFAIYLETAFSYETYYQSTGRIYRIGQDENVRIYHIYYEDTVDMFHIDSIENKKSLVDTLFAKTKVAFSLQQIKSIFEGKQV